MKSISTKITIFVSIIIMLSMSVLSAILVTPASRARRELLLTNYEANIQLDAINLEKMYDIMDISLKSVAGIIEQNNLRDSKDIMPILLALFKSNPDTFDLFVAFEDNTAIFGSEWVPEADYVATERPWYIAGVQNPGVSVFTEPYLDAQTGKICTTLCYGQEKDGKIQFVTAMDVFFDKFLESISQSKINEMGYCMLINKNGEIYHHENEEFNPAVDESFNLKDLDNGRYSPIFAQTVNSGNFVQIKDYTGVDSYFIPVPINNTDWMVCGVIPVSYIDKEMWNQIITSIIVTLIFVLIAVLTIYLTLRRIITKPLNKIVSIAKIVSVGDINVNVDTSSNDEIGIFAKSFQEIIDGTKAKVLCLESIAKGDLTSKVLIQSENDKMGKALSDMIRSNNHIISNILEVSDNVSDSSGQISKISQILSESAVEQDNAVNRLSQNINHISSITDGNVKLSKETKNLSKEIMESAQKGNSQMEDMLKAVNDIHESSQNINKVIKVIDDIAFQTNILALNAAVEAARAGQHGKGFAVVAEEVRNLASKSAEAAKNTSSLITDSMVKAEMGTKIAQETSVSFSSILDGINKTSEKIDEISQSSFTQYSALNEISADVLEVTKVVSKTNESARDCEMSSETMNRQADTLHGLVSQFKLNG